MIKVGNHVYASSADLPQNVPVFPLAGALLLPNGQLPLNIFEPRYVAMLEDALANDRIIGMIQPSLKQEITDEGPVPLSDVGCLGRITAFQESGDGRYLISLSGICRYKVITELPLSKGYRNCQIEIFESDLYTDQQEDHDIPRERLIEAFRNYLSANGMDADWETIEQTDNSTLLTALCMMSPYDPAEKQAILEAPDLRSRTETLIAISEFHLAKEELGPDRMIQ